MTHIEPWEMPGKCTLGYGPKTIVVQQVLGERHIQKSVDVHVRVPRRKPSIEQIVDVFVKKLCITDVDVIHHKVVVRGEFEVKALYVACKPRQPVHAVEVWPVRFTAYADIRGARPGMEADASVVVEFVDYDIEKHSRTKWHKKKHHEDYSEDDTDCSDDYDDCEDEYEDDCDHDCDDDCHYKHKSLKKHKFNHKCKEHCKPHKCHCFCTRHFNVSVVLGITVKVMTDREVVVQPGPQVLPYKPKG